MSLFNPNLVVLILANSAIRTKSSGLKAILGGRLARAVRLPFASDFAQIPYDFLPHGRCKTGEGRPNSVVSSHATLFVSA